MKKAGADFKFVNEGDVLYSSAQDNLIFKVHTLNYSRIEY